MLYMSFIIVIAWAWWVGIFSTNTNCKAVSFRDEWSVAEVGCGTELVATVAEAVMLQQQQQHSFSRDITLFRSLAQGPHGPFFGRAGSTARAWSWLGRLWAWGGLVRNLQAMQADGH